MSVLTAVLTLALLAAVIVLVSGPLRATRTPKGIPTREHPEGHTRRTHGKHPEGHTQRAHGRQAGEPAESPERAELETAREAKYWEIRDAELDYRTGKLSREDYEEVNGALRAEAVEILDRLEALGEQEQAPDSPK
jgi:hypothetical protein